MLDSTASRKMTYIWEVLYSYIKSTSGHSRHTDKLRSTSRHRELGRRDRDYMGEITAITAISGIQKTSLRIVF